jgi:hypothetical protein
MQPWHIAVFAAIGAAGVASFFVECALCRRKRSDRSPGAA